MLHSRGSHDFRCCIHQNLSENDKTFYLRQTEIYLLKNYVVNLHKPTSSANQWKERFLSKVINVIGLIKIANDDFTRVRMYVM